MPPSDQHRSGTGATPAPRDRRPTELADHAHSHGLMNQAQKQLGLDPHRGMGIEWLAHANRRHLYAGHIVYSLPYKNWYRVQLDGTGSTIGCTLGTESNFTPLGPRSGGTIAPHNAVIVWVPPGRVHGVILAVYPLIRHDSRLPVSDCIQQGSMAGYKREKAYDEPHRLLHKQGGIRDFSANRPVDATTLEWTKVTELGLGLGIDPFMTWMRANEFCGVWFHWWDSHTRLAGQNMDIVSYPLEIILREDEGENRHIEYGNTYPWETLGLYGHGTPLHQEFDDDAVQKTLPKGKYDLPDDGEDLQPVSRYQEHGGYLGQGRHRWLMIPAKDSGKRRYRDDPARQPDMGVFEETIALDGTYALRFAKQGFIGKHVLIPVPKEMRLPEDQKTGDDARKDNYKFSGTFGGGAAHRVQDIAVAGDCRHQLQVAGVLDTLAYNYNWKPLHPFHYHKEDYQVPQERDIQNKAGAPARAQDRLEFGTLQGQMYMDYPQPRKVKVDDRYGDVEFFQRQAGISFLPDGGVVLFDGYGAQITLSAGHIRFDCPGDIQLFGGRSVVALGGDDICLRARNSLDLTAGRKDVTIKAEKNLRMIGGNAEQGGVLIESKKPFAADYANKVGEEIVSGGIVLKAPQGSIVNWASEIYLRTGGGDLRPGRIVLDAARGGDRVILKGDAVDIFSQSATNLWVGPHGEIDQVAATYNFAADGATLDKGVTVGGYACILGPLVQKGAMLNTGGYMAVSGHPLVMPADGGKLNEDLGQRRKALDEQKKAGEAAHKAHFTADFYAVDRPGHDKTIEAVDFSLRDDGGGQYGVAAFQLIESRWQQMARLGLGSGGKPWSDEPPVTYQGRLQLPYPSKAKWQDEPTLQQYQQYTLFDADQGLSKDRPGPYEDPALAALAPTTCAAGFTVISDS